MSFTPYKVKAVYEYKSQEPDDLPFPNGQIITVIGEEDNDWYSGEYLDAAGTKVEGIFPRNFVEKYEPTVPSRPSRAPKRTQTSEVDAPTTAPEATGVPVPKSSAVQQPETVREAPIEPPGETRTGEPETPSSPPTQSTAETSKSSATSPPSGGKPGGTKAAPPVAEKPTSSSFKDRIAAFNKPTAAPITPFKPAGQGSSGFIKKPFVAPPPSKNAYVPPPREPPQKVYRREEDLAASQELPAKLDAADSTPQTLIVDEESQLKPTSLKERIALLQKQQAEQAARYAESSQKKEKPKKPPKTRTESSEKVEQVEAPTEVAEPIHEDQVPERSSVDFADDDTGSLRGTRRRQSGHVPIGTPPPPARELVSDTNDADDSGAADTEDALETSTEEDRAGARHRTTSDHFAPPVRQASTKETGNEDRPESRDTDEEGGVGEEDEEEDEEEDPELRRKRELRERMAKMSGGMGMMGMFGPPGGMPARGTSKRSRQSSERDQHTRDSDQAAATAPPAPIMALPGMSNMRQSKPEVPPDSESEDEATAQPTPVEPLTQVPTGEDGFPPQPPARVSTDRAPPPVPIERQAPLPPSRDLRGPPPLPPPDRPLPPMPSGGQSRAVPPPPPSSSRPSAVDDDAEDKQSPHMPSSTSRPVSKDGLALVTNQSILIPDSGPAAGEATSSSPPMSRRAARAPPPLPPSSPTAAAPQNRAPPPPPPSHPPRRSTGDSHSAPPIPRHVQASEDDEQVTEYDGDYDTDIASGAKHKDALKSHNRDSSLDEELLTDEPSQMDPPSRTVPPLPPAAAPREAPPPPHGGPKSRKSMDAPRAAPPPIPPPRDVEGNEDDYDPFRYSAPQHGLASPPIRPPFTSSLQSPREELEQEDMYKAPPSAPRNLSSVPNERQPVQAAPLGYGEPTRRSTDFPRTSTQSRTSMDQSRGSGDQGLLASDVILSPSSLWWTHENTPPPGLQNRPDVLCEYESSTSTKRGGRAQISRDVYVLYMDYSQTTVNASFDPNDPAHVTFEQSHDRPPPIPRQDQLEQASVQFGHRIADAALKSMNTTVPDGSAHGFVYQLITTAAGPEALKPVGNRAYGAQVYANLANASTQQIDEIRRGDIITFRNAKFVGHKGSVMPQKYSVDVGVSGGAGHVGVVMEWDGTKRKVRVWEQGRDHSSEAGGSGKKDKAGSIKVREESYRIGDLRSGEVRVWRVMPRSYVGWNKG